LSGEQQQSEERRLSKYAPRTRQIERQGIALIATVFSALGHNWNENQVDVGIDGWVELVKKPKRKATGRIVLVQSKATSVPFRAGAQVTFVCRDEDLRYWLNGNAPVILVRSHPASGEAYFVSVKDYFAAHPEQRASRKIVFDRDQDRFGKEMDEALWQLARPRHDGLHLGPPPVRETLVSNLLPITRMPEHFYAAPADVKMYSQARARLRAADARSLRAWGLSSDTVFSFHDPATTAIDCLCAGSADAIATDEWAESDDAVVQKQFVQLLNGALEEQTWPAARRGKDHATLYVAAPEDLSSVEVPGRSGQTRTIVKAYCRADDSLKYVRHLALDRRFRRYGDTWYLEIVPSYFFSRDGYWQSGFAAKHLSRIKRIERHNDVRRHVETWSWILRGEIDFGGMAPDPNRRLLEFGPLADVELDNWPEDEIASPETTEAAAQPVADNRKHANREHGKAA
jgi:hypothetical protein